MTVAASPARLPSIPIKIIVGTMIRFDARLTTEIINLSKYPDFSAAPTPIITAKQDLMQEIQKVLNGIIHNHSDTFSTKNTLYMYGFSISWMFH